MTAYIALGLFRDGLFSATASGFAGFAAFIAAGFAGMFVGTLVFGFVSDRFGRRATFGWSLLFYSVATVIMAFMPSAKGIDGWRFLAGVGIGVQTITIDAYVSEVVPRSARGQYIALSQALTYTAVPVVALLSALLVPHSFGALSGWRWVALFGGLGALFVGPLQRGMPESPRWLESRGENEAASAALSQIDDAWRPVAETNPTLVAVDSGGEAVSGRLREVWNPTYRGRTVMLMIFNLVQTVGFYGFASWIPVLLFARGVTFMHSLQYTFLMALAAPVGPVVAMYLSDAAQRKWQVVGLACGMAALGLIFAALRAPALVVIAGVAITVTNNWFSCAFHTYQAELYPTRIRGRAIGFVYSWSRFSAIFVGFWIAATLARFGVTGVFALIAAAMLVAAGAVAFAGPLTNRIPLETIAP
ncbi:MAG: MFS transporter [Candidatus Eremiobacteraeota bacterium]|nr:MFS transporter [Candidatus Eremiobacteraeota bacterium]MBC5826229.1 MFS transporter [Candidatus Eremiobacteraeota bacterium]